MFKSFGHRMSTLLELVDQPCFVLCCCDNRVNLDSTKSLSELGCIQRFLNSQKLDTNYSRLTEEQCFVWPGYDFALTTPRIHHTICQKVLFRLVLTIFMLESNEHQKGSLKPLGPLSVKANYCQQDYIPEKKARLGQVTGRISVGVWCGALVLGSGCSKIKLLRMGGLFKKRILEPIRLIGYHPISAEIHLETNSFNPY
ncbi:hypothetical protein BpHYR1_032542 [Brachionus plicatilis]|uniref:Uncharacterized protein n=1 Tax=Brachionus plicatilis TaxID=10195 RepID=A0A3M7QBQ2_BRAPC|nr:hypothetical protein BpHYR1_032542 [Brachionus plicatilis]